MSESTKSNKSKILELCSVCDELLMTLPIFMNGVMILEARTK